MKRAIIIAATLLVSVSAVVAQDYFPDYRWERRERIREIRRAEYLRAVRREEWRRQQRREARREARRDDGRYAHCGPQMKAAGDADVNEEAARSKAIKSLQDQIINELGERYLNVVDNAIIIDEHCDPARVGEPGKLLGGNMLELKRCVIIARPCQAPSRARE